MPSLKVSVLLAVTCAAALHAQQAGQKPDFIANVDYVEIPVRVLDNRGRFVGGLTQSDFEVLEDGATQRVVDFTIIGSSSSRARPSVEARPTASGPVSTTLYAIVLDDFHISREDTFKARSLVLEFIRRYAASDDSLTIVFTSGSPGQDFTRDRTVLSSALERLRGQMDANEPPALREANALGVIRLIRQVSRGFAETPRSSRRAIILVTAGVGCSPAASSPSRVPWCGSDLADALREAAASDVVVYSVDPRGVRNAAWTGLALDPRGGAGPPGFFDGMHALANETGGFSVTGTDGFADAFRRIVSDFSEYYLLGYYSGRRDVGAPLRHNEVRVSRPGVKAFYRSTYVAPR